jgi:predicted Zn-dependent protease with MMP-like domain/Tfp pilus assembly protein PilF
MAETLEAQLEAGWLALDKGETKRARAEADRALALDAEAPEVHTLLGAVAAQEGDVDGAMDSFKRAIELDPEYFDPVFLAAQLAAADGELEDALTLAEGALNAAEEEDEFLDALLLKAELELGLDDADAAAETLAELPPVDLPEAAFHVRAGGCFLELDDLETAERHFRTAVKLDPGSGDGYHGLGMTAEAAGESKEQVEHFLKVRELDLAAPAPPWTVTDAQLEERVEAALGELPERARKLLANVPILVEPYPSKELISDGVDPRTLGLFSGTPYPEQANVAGQAPHLEHVLLFKRNLERDARTREEVEQEIRTTLLHETGHFFGMDEEDLEEVGLD